MTQQITVQVTIHANADVVWNCWTQPEHITNWNHASDKWYCPHAENALKTGGRYCARMAAKDGSAGFDYEAIHEKIVPLKEIVSVMTDDRRTKTTFVDLSGETRVTTTFDADPDHPVDMQKQGWQAILDNFKMYVEAPSLQIVRKFNVTPEVVFDAFTKPEAMRVWWTEDTVFDINLQVGGKWTITRQEDGVTYTMTGEYLEIERPNRLCYTVAMPQFSPNSDRLTIDILPIDSGCVVTFVQSGKDIASELQALEPGNSSPSKDGWQQGFDLMEAAWNKNS